MLLRPADVSGDILPVLSSRVLLSGPEAVARLAEYRLSLLAGEWWEICTQKSSRPNVTANELSHITGSGLSGTGSVTE